MSLRPLIGVTCGLVGIDPPRLGVNVTYVRALQAAGADPILLPPGTDPSVASRLDALLLPGGVDVDPALYHEAPEPGLGETERARDELELAMLDAAAARGLPVLGVCRGIQLINVHRGGSLYQDLANLDFHNPKGERTLLAHTISLEGGRLQRVNSIHHQGLKSLGSGLRVTARSEDGLVEAVESEDGLVVAVQCHPEELTADPWAKGLFEHLVRQAQSRD